MADLIDEPSLNEEIGTLSGDTPLSGHGELGELTFDNSGPMFAPEPADPMRKLHLPQLKHKSSTSYSVTGGGFNGGNSGGGGGPVGSGGPAPKGLVGYAKKFLGTPYVWGGTSPNGFDCSGFVQYVYRKFGVNLPRISADQARAGKRISLGNLKPGDLVAWDNSSRNNGADHIAIYIGNGQIIEAPRPGSSVRISRLYDTGNAWGVRIGGLGGGGAVGAAIGGTGGGGGGGKPRPKKRPRRPRRPRNKFENDL